MRLDCLGLALGVLISSLSAEIVPALHTTGYEAWYGVADSLEASCSWLPHPYVVLRTFFVAGDSYFLGVDPRTLHTVVRREKNFILHGMAWSSLDSLFAQTSYFRLLRGVRQSRDFSTDVGLVRVPADHGFVLTVDLCPSRKPLDRNLIGKLLDALEPVERPIPIAISISGAWIRAHRQDLRWLISLENSGLVAVTWIDHSNRHRYIRGLEASKNFMLLPGTDLNAEVMLAEQTMLEEGLLPSLFFRFPGLISNRLLVSNLLGLGLVPIGCDIWLAKNPHALPGSIVLIHGNGNEPLGVQRFLELLVKEKADIGKHRWRLLDLEGSLVGKF